MADAVYYLAGVVHGTVVSTQLNDGQAERTFFFSAFRSNFSQLFADVGFFEASVVDTADEAVGVTGSLQINRDGAAGNQRTDGVGFVVVAVEQYQVAFSQQGVGYHFVGRRSAVQNEIGFVGIEHFGSVLLGCAGRTFVNQQVAQANVGVAQVSTEYVFTEEFEEFAAGRMFAVELAALVSGAVELSVTDTYILLQCAEEGRSKFRTILFYGSVYLFAVVLFIAAAQLDNTINAGQQAFGHAFAGLQSNEYRNTEAGGFNLLHSLGCIGSRSNNSTNTCEVGTLYIHHV